MKSILERHYIVEYMIAESNEEDQEIKRIIKEVKEEQGKINLSDYKLVLPKDNTIRELKKNSV